MREANGVGASGGDVVEVTLTWGGGGDGAACVLATKYLRAGDRFAVGEGDECDALVPSEVLRATQIDLVTFDPSGAPGPVVSPPHGAHVWVDGFPAPAEAMTLAPGGIGNGCGGKPCLLGGTHKTGTSLRMPREITTNGRLPKDVIQRIVRLSAGRFRACYESALRTNPALEGRVEVRFVIGRDGQVAMAQDGESDLPNDAVKGCIVKSFYALSFPPPMDGTVTVTYPMALTPAQ